MKKILLSAILALIIIFFISPNNVNAGWVNGYWKKDGTYVPGYWRSDPNGLKYDNYSFDGDWSDAFNNSYYSSDRNYSSDWYTPSWVTQDDYWVGKSFYDQKNSYQDYSYDLFDYDYDFWDDPIYNYTPSYDYSYEPIEFYQPSYSMEPLYKPSYDIYEPLYEPLYNPIDPYDSFYDYDLNSWDY